MQEVTTMKARERWEDLANMAAGAWLFATPWFFHTKSNPAISWDSWLSGGAIAVVAMWALANPESMITELINGMLAAWTFIAPWALHFANMGSVAWNARIVGVVVGLLALMALYDQDQGLHERPGSQSPARS